MNVKKSCYNCYRSKVMDDEPRCVLFPKDFDIPERFLNEGCRFWVEDA